MTYAGHERRRHKRIDCRFIVSYRVLEGDQCRDLSQTKNLSLGGMLLTTNTEFAANTKLALEIRLPFDLKPVKLTARVIQSHEVTRDLIYDTRLEFLSIEESPKKIINQTVDYYVKRGVCKEVEGKDGIRRK